MKAGKAKIVKMTEENLDMDALREAGRILRSGGLVAFPTETVYGLGGMPWIRRLHGGYTRRREDLRTIR